MTFNFDGTELINLILLIALLGFMWRINRGVGDKLDALRLEFKQGLAKLESKFDDLSRHVSRLSERVARIEGRLERPWERFPFSEASTGAEEAIPAVTDEPCASRAWT